MKPWNITEENAGKRLDIFLHAQEPGSSRGSIQKAIKEGHVAVNGKPVSVHRFLKTGDVVEWKKGIVAPAPTIAKRKAAISSVATADPATIAETPDWIVINKPIGLLVHPARQTEEPTLVDWLVTHDPKIARIGEDPSRPGIVHRLDREVSGLMVVAKTPDAFDSLKRQFAAHTVDKTYLALVYGEVSRDSGDIKFRIARSSTKARMAARPVEETGGRAAWTHYRVHTRYHNATLLEIEILSGRTHQIRAHLHALGHPVMGDPLYALKNPPRNITPPRLMLQSIGLDFDDPKTHERRTFRLEPDAAFAAVTRLLKPSAQTRQHA